MPLTRNIRRHELLENSRSHRSGRLTSGNTSNVSHLWRVRKLPAFSLPAPKQGKTKITSDRSRQSNARGQVLGSRTRRSTSVLREQRETSRNTDGTDCNEHDGHHLMRCDSDSPAPNPAASSLPMSQQSIIVAEEETTRSRPQEQAVEDGPVEQKKRSPPCLEDVGLPLDGLWDHDVAYGHRFCFDHGGTEYLLGTADRWMSPDDFDIPAREVKLETMLQEHRSSLAEFNPHSRHCQAECKGSLFSHIFSVVDKRTHGNRTLYWIRWKACWTPKSHIDNQDWIPASLEANKDRHRRYSTRVAKDVEKRTIGNEKIMLVVNIE